MTLTIATADDVRAAEGVIRQHISPAPLIRSYRLEQQLGFPESRRVWLKDYGWTPVGSFKLMGALNWMAANLERVVESDVFPRASIACEIAREQFERGDTGCAPERLEPVYLRNQVAKKPGQ